MTGTAPPIWSRRSKPGKSCLPISYDGDALRQSLAARGAWANVKRISRRREKPAFSAFLYRYRNLVERFFCKLKQYRGIATRFDKLATTFLAGVLLVCVIIWLN